MSYIHQGGVAWRAPFMVEREERVHEPRLQMSFGAVGLRTIRAGPEEKTLRVHAVALVTDLEGVFSSGKEDA